MRRLLRNLVLPAVVVAILVGLIYRSRHAIKLEGFSWTLLLASIRNARHGLLLLSLAGIFVAYALRALRWVSFSRYIGRPNFGRIYSATLVGFTAIFLLGRAGEPVRPMLIAHKDRLPLPGTFGIYVLERVLDVASMAALGALSLLLLPGEILSGGDDESIVAVRTAGAALLFGLLGVIAFLIYFRFHGAGLLGRWLAVWRERRGWRHRVANFFAGFSEGLQAIRTLRDLVLAVFYSAVHWLLIGLIYLWICHSFGGDLAELGLPEIMLVLAITMAGAMVQLPIAGGGAQVATFVALTSVFGVENEPAAAASILLWLITFAACSLVGIPLLVREGWSMRELWQLARAQTRAETIAAHSPPRKAAGPPRKVSR